MEIEYNGVTYQVPGCCGGLGMENEIEVKENNPHCLNRFDCRWFGVCIWAAEGRRGRHITEEMPERRRVG